MQAGATAAYLLTPDERSQHHLGRFGSLTVGFAEMHALYMIHAILSCLLHSCLHCYMQGAVPDGCPLLRHRCSDYFRPAASRHTSQCASGTTVRVVASMAHFLLCMLHLACSIWWTMCGQDVLPRTLGNSTSGNRASAVHLHSLTDVRKFGGNASSLPSAAEVRDMTACFYGPTFAYLTVMLAYVIMHAHPGCTPPP